MRFLRRVFVGILAAQGLFAGPAWAQYGNALDFLGDDDYVALPNESDFDFTSTMTVEAWIWVRTFDTSYQAIVTKGDYSWRIQRSSNQDTIEFSCDTPSGNLHLYGAIGVNDGNWHHVAGVFDNVGGTIKLYVDGVLDQSDIASGTISDTSDPVFIGSNSSFPPLTTYGMGE